ncbi:sensor histidine kinase [Xiamenia xianingshaonis]|uniref:histidine kinase n=1 Tax=Xiamenia xianingshaonis TaxID=2682776 RepID=A0A9E6STW4_9ACTN|nr:HAMP domain-containing sensor histidine kinase [Xiamenia xianingshaonis]NHM13800.1 sensor histidine kinase [Xiamenia xianingshaonis]QTU83662.1 HAMP domain-containing histidine kinase [Xiamenia xianingshaonis]
MRNRSLLCQLVLVAAATAAFSAAAWTAAGPLAALLVAGCGSFALAAAAAFGFARYREIAHLADAIDRVLHEGRSVSFSQCREGDVAILSNEMQKMVARLVRTADALEQEKRALATSMEDISHQIRTPMTAIALMVPAIEQADDALERKRALRNLEAQVDRTSWLVTSLLKLAKADAGALDLADGPVDVGAAAERAAEPLLVAFDLKDVALHIDCAPGASLRGDARWIAEALGNVLKNCLEHTPAKGAVTLSAREDALSTRIVVEDTGPGFAPDDLPRVFDRFYRGGAADVGEGAGGGLAGEGFGIGLALARALAEAQGGTLVAANGEAGGARFTFAFPKFVV